MKQVLFLLIFVFGVTTFAQSQIYKETEGGGGMALNGVLHQKGTYKPVSGAKIAVKGTGIEIYADGQGFFVIPNVNGGGGVWLQISAEDYETLDMPVNIGGIQELGIIFMTLNQRNVDPITVNDLRAAGSDVSNQSFSQLGTSALLIGTNDVLVNASNYNLGNLGLRLRGYEWKNTDVYFNGVPMNDEGTGFASPLLWNGLNDATVKAEGSYGLNSTLLYFGDIGGVSNMRIRPSEFRKRFKASYGFSNSLYSHRLTATYTSGVMDNGLSLFVSASGRTGNGFADVTKFDGVSYLVVAEKEIDVNQTLMLTIMGAPTKRNVQNYSTQEAYDIADNNFYNSAWGINGNNKKLSSRTNQFHQPLISLSHNWDINDWTLLRTTAGFTFGKNSETGIKWTTDVDDPRPDTYDKLPTIFTDPNNQQINWQNIYESNTGVMGEPLQSKYISGAQHADRITATLNSIYDTEITDKLVTTIGVQGRFYRGSFYNKVDNLYEGSFWRDIDKFTGVPPPNHEQNDLNHPDRDVKKGDKFDYDYNMSQMTFDIWNKWAMDWRRWSFTASASASYTSYWRDGNMKNGKFPDSSEGKSATQKFFNFAAKAGTSYPLFAGSRVEVYGTYATHAPLFRDAYLLPQISDMTADLKSETVWGGELNYLMSGAFFNLRLSGFYTQFANQTRTRFYYDNDNQSQISMSLTELNKRHFGGELSVDMKLLADLTLKAGAVYGVYKYTSNPTVTLIQQNMMSINKSIESQMNGLYVAGTPQLAATAGLLYDFKKWWIGVNVNYAGNNYADVNPMRFTESAMAAIAESPDYQSYIGQEKFKTAFTFDIYGGYTLELGNKYLGLNVNAHNLLGNKKAVLGGYEPLVNFDTTKAANKYATNYIYTYGRTIFLILSFRF